MKWTDKQVVMFWLCVVLMFVAIALFSKPRTYVVNEYCVPFVCEIRNVENGK